MNRQSAAAAVLLAVGLLVGPHAAALAAPYPPPATGSGSAAPSRVKQGKCTTFSGDGFTVAARVEIYDDQAHYGTTSAGNKGEFKSRVCFANDAKIGDHVLSAHGANAKTLPNDPDERVVTATVTVVGVRESDPELDSNNAASTSGTDVLSPFGLAVAGLLLLPFVTGVLLLLEQRHRRRRRAG
jgi:hypothetical protein